MDDRQAGLLTGVCKPISSVLGAACTSLFAFLGLRASPESGLHVWIVIRRNLNAAVVVLAKIASFTVHQLASTATAKHGQLSMQLSKVQS